MTEVRNMRVRATEAEIENIKRVQRVTGHDEEPLMRTVQRALERFEKTESFMG